MEESKLKTVGLFAGLSRREIRRLSSVTDEVVVPEVLSVDERAGHPWLMRR